MKIKIIVSIVVAGFILGIGGYFLRANLIKNKVASSTNSTNKLSTTTRQTSSNSNNKKDKITNKTKGNPEAVTLGYDKQGKLVIKPFETKKEDLPKPPLLSKPILFNIEFSSEEKAKMIKEIKKTVAILKKDSANFDNWIELGLLRKAIGDYRGAEKAWKYAGLIRPQSNIPFYDLGYLYHNFLKEYPQSEQNFLKAIKNDKSYIITYKALFDLYKNSYKQNTNKAENILLIGIKNNPNNIFLEITLAEYYKDKDENKKALERYNKALKLAEAIKNIQLVNQLKKEVSNLQK